MMTECVQALGGLDVLVNNAGIAGPTASVENMEPDEWKKVMQVDLTGRHDGVGANPVFTQFDRKGFW